MSGFCITFGHENTSAVSPKRQFLYALQPGDKVQRLLAGIVPMTLNVSHVDDKVITCGPWTFDRDTGIEIDEDLGWGTAYSGSYLVPSTEDE